jgi:hypothetical protein
MRDDVSNPTSKVKDTARVTHLRDILVQPLQRLSLPFDKNTRDGLERLHTRRLARDSAGYARNEVVSARNARGVQQTNEMRGGIVESKMKL